MNESKYRKLHGIANGLQPSPKAFKPSAGRVVWPSRGVGPARTGSCVTCNDGVPKFVDADGFCVDHIAALKPKAHATAPVDTVQPAVDVAQPAPETPPSA